MLNSNPIEINKSSLVSLKAEILRKQQEINVTKLQERPELSKNVLKSKKKFTPKEKESNISDDEEHEQLLAKSRQILETKANLYDSLSKRASNPTEEDKEITKRLLVQFDQKESTIDSDKECHSDEYEPAKNSDEEWVEYVDFLGRTRTCLRKDLKYMRRKDSELSDSVDSRREEVNKKTFVKDTEQEDEEKVENTSENLSEQNEMLSSDMRRELLRREWEKQEEELLKKKDIHYQDVLFNEARFHGAGYYSFSKDEEERVRQQQNLNKLREETTKQQQTTAEIKKLREKQLAARLKAARNRKRARMGLPLEPDECDEKQEEKQMADDEEKKRLMVVKEEEERQKQTERSKTVRPWDIGKEILKTHYEYSQDEWVSKQRDQRPKEFAPPPLYSNFNAKRPIINEISEPEDKRLFFTSKKAKINVSSSSTVTSNESKNNVSSCNVDATNLEESVIAGLRFLRKQSEKQNIVND